MVLDIVIAILLLINVAVRLEDPAHKILIIILIVLMILWVVMAFSGLGLLRLRS